MAEAFAVANYWLVLSLLVAILFFALYSRISPGWQSRTSQMEARVSNRTPFALPVFSIDKFTVVSPTRRESSFNDILRLAIITSKLITIAMIK